MWKLSKPLSIQTLFILKKSCLAQCKKCTTPFDLGDTGWFTTKSPKWYCLDCYDRMFIT